MHKYILLIKRARIIVTNIKTYKIKLIKRKDHEEKVNLHDKKP